MNELVHQGRKAAGQGGTVSIRPVDGLPLVAQGDDIAALIGDALSARDDALVAGDIVVIAQKVVSKAEGRCVDLATVTPSPRARELAAETGKDPRLVELILAESEAVLRTREGLIVVVHRRGYVLANAGIDQSNIAGGEDDEHALLLPVDPDASCRRIRRALGQRFGVEIAVIINDSLGRAWRNGTIGTALGTDGLSPVRDLRGRRDLFGRPLQSSLVGVADEIAAAASLVQGQADEGRPVVVVRGLAQHLGGGRGADLVRAQEQDLFR